MLVDGSYCLYAAYYATEDANLRNSQGEPTGALYGFLQQVYRLQRDCQPSHFAVMMDSQAPTWRKKEFKDYKAHRRCPEDLKPQFGKARRALEALAVPWKAMDGFEADDLIGSYAWEASNDCDVGIVSVDKDLMQLASKKVRILTNLKAADLQSEGNWIDDDRVEEVWGVRPSQIVDLLSLTGDTADSIPGVPGIGKKKAAALLRRHKTLDRIFEAAHTGSVQVNGVGPKLVQSLVQHESSALKMRELVKLRAVEGLDAKDWRSFRVPTHDQRWVETAQEYLRRESMESLIERLDRDSVQSESSSRRSRANKPPPSVAKVEDAAAAKRAMEVLERHCEDEGRLFFVNVEAAKDRSRALCFSVYGGRDLDFGGSPRLWVDLMGSGDWARNDELIDAFRNFFVDSRFRKVYHCFSEAWRPLAGLALGPDGGPSLPHGGFAADTLHMARLLDPSLKSYELEKLCTNLGARTTLAHERSRRSLLLRPNQKGNTPEQLQLQQRDEWVLYATSGAAALHELYSVLRSRLRKKPWTLEGPQGTPKELEGLTLWDLYLRIWQPLGQILLGMELRGVPADRARLDRLEAEALREARGDEDTFLEWAKQRIAEEHGPQVASASDVEAMNLNSTDQVSHLLFGPLDAAPREFKMQVEPEDTTVAAASSSADAPPAAGRDVASAVDEGEQQQRPATPASSLSREELEGLKMAELVELLKESGLKVTGKKAVLVDRLLDPNAEPAKPRSRTRWARFNIPGLGLEPLKDFVTKLKKQPQVSIESLQALAVQRADVLRPEGCAAIAALVRRQEVEAVLSGFLWPLRSYVTDEDRVHAYINLNTETGRLSSRQPNLMGEPLGKRVPLREAFAAPPGKRLIVADYGQLELRVLAHLADCPSMIELLSSGGDIHSRTAHLMFEEVREAVTAGEVTVDASWPGAAPGLPMVKERFPEERRRAKVMNFSVLYGKTAFTLAKEWDITQREAEQMITKWYDSFPEVRSWKERMEAADTARTLLGRERPVRRKMEEQRAQRWDGRWKGRMLNAHVQRMASNTPVQGSAADIVVSAMLRLEESQRLRDLGYQQVLQVHDEVLLEGPEEYAEEALEEVIKLMEDPLPFGLQLRVPLKVDARHAPTWQEGKPS